MSERVTPLINNFNAGEIDPKIDARSDIAKYYSGCRTLEGMIPFVEGGASRSPGTHYVAGVKTSSKGTRVIPFHFSTIQAYIIELGDLYIRFYKDEGQILSGLSAYEIASPYLEADLFELKFVQSADVVYISHPDYATKKLTRTGHTAWTLTDWVAKVGVEMTITGISKANPAVVTCSDVPTTLAAGDYVYIKDVVGMTEVNNLFFTAGTVVTGAGGTFQLSGVDSQAYNAYVSGGKAQESQFGVSGGRPSCAAFYEQRLVVAGWDNSPHALMASAVGDYEDFNQDATDDSAAIGYTLDSGMVDRIRWMISEEYLLLGTVGGVWKFDLPTTPTTNPPSAKKHIYTGVADIQPVVVGDFIFWVTRSGRVVRRIVFEFGNDKYNAPDMTRLARHITIGDTEANSGIVDMAYQQEPIPILWAVRADGQLAGMVCDIEENVFAWFRLVTDGLFESVAVISQDGAEDQVWVVVNRTIGGSTVRYVEYFAPHEFFSEIKDCFFVHSGLSFDGGDAVNITGISKAATAVVSVAAWPADGAGTDLADGDKVMIEGVVGMTEVNQTYPLSTPYTVAGANKGALTFQLSGINSTAYTAWSSGGTVKIVKAAFTTLDHLVGKSVVALADGYPCPEETVAAGGNATFDYFGNQVHAGLPYTPVVEPMKLHAGSQAGTARGKRQKISKITACFYETGYGVKVGPDANSLKFVKEGMTEGELNTVDSPFEFTGDWKDEATLYITQTKPLPMTILGLVPRLNLNED